MSLKILDACYFNTATTGLTDFAVGAAVQGYQLPAGAGAANGDTFYYRAQDPTNANWEVGLGTYSTTGPTLARTTVIFSSNANAKVSFGTGVVVFATLTAEQLSALIGLPTAMAAANWRF